MIHTVYLCFGSNAGCREANIEAARQRVEAVAQSLRMSAPRESTDASGLGGPYVNVVAECRTALGLEELRSLLRRFESEGGRTPESKARGVMPIDIDIVEWDGAILSPDDFNRPYYREARQELLV